MKKLIILLCFLPFIGNAATYYVSSSGNNSNAGSLSAPWATWQKGFTSLSAGDTLYIRGGTYTPSTTYGNSRDNCVYVSARSGTSSNKIYVYNYPNEVPVLKGTNLPRSNTNKSGIHFNNSHYWVVTGLVIENIEDTGGTSNFGIGWYEANSNYITLINCVSRYNDGPGVAVNGFCDYSYFINCDSYLNVDNHASGDFADGFIASHYGGRGKYHTIFQECRAWNNSDDGFDAFVSDAGNTGGYITYDRCWAFRNGYPVTAGGDGAGLKWGGSQTSTEAGVQRVINNCISAGNKSIGIDQSESPYIGVLYNNFSYANGSQGFYNNRNTACYFRNNISYANTGQNWITQSNFVQSNNSWNGGVTVTDVDFGGLNVDELSAARQSNGNLPEITSFKLVQGSDLIDAGIANIYPGWPLIPFDGVAPDLGCFEYKTVVPPTMKLKILVDSVIITIEGKSITIIE